MYKMSSDAKRLTKERKITAETYSKSETHTIRVCRKFAHGHYVIWVKMIDSKKRLCHRNLYHVAMKKIKSFCGTKHPTKVQVKKYKRKMSQRINDDKSVYIREDFAYKIIWYTNLGVIEADKFRKNLSVKMINQFE